MTGDVVVVHNGIVENFLELREELSAEGAVFNSDTDTEVIVHLVERYLSRRQDLAEAARKALAHLKGAHGIVVLSSREPDKIVAARIGNAGGVVIGLGEGEMFIASDMPAILEHTRRVVFLESRQMAVVTREGLTSARRWMAQPLEYRGAPGLLGPGRGRKGRVPPLHAEGNPRAGALADRYHRRAGGFRERAGVRLPELNLTAEQAQRIEKIFITACGTAAHAGMVGKVLIEHIARIPVEVDIASEFRYRDPIVDEDTVVLAISQSGETADTLAAMEEGRRKGRHAVVDRQRHRLAGHAHRRWLHLHADRPGDRRGLHQGLHRAAGGPVYAGDPAGRPARHAG